MRARRIIRVRAIRSSSPGARGRRRAKQYRDNRFAHPVKLKRCDLQPPHLKQFLKDFTNLVGASLRLYHACMSFPAKQVRAALPVVLLLLLAVPAETADQNLARDAMRVLNANCLSCHNPEKHKGGLQMTSRELLLKGSDSGPVIQEDQPIQSLLLKVLAADADPQPFRRRRPRSGRLLDLGDRSVADCNGHRRYVVFCRFAL